MEVAVVEDMVEVDTAEEDTVEVMAEVEATEEAEDMVEGEEIVTEARRGLLEEALERSSGQMTCSINSHVSKRTFMSNIRM